MEFIHDWLITATLGEGAFGEVKLLQHKTSQESVALKILHCHRNKPEHSEIEATIQKEIHIHQQLKHENIIKFYGARMELDVWYIFLEYADGGELYDRIEPDVGLIPHTKAHAYFSQIISGACYLHEKGVAHRDLKPENILLSRDTIKISDFGFATLYRNKEGVERLLGTQCGTPPYLAPEVLLGKTYKAMPVDVWSCGIILVVMLGGELPWDKADPTHSPEYQAWQTSTPTSPPWTKFDLATLNFLKRLLCPLPSKRINFEAILEHKWMTQGKNKRKNLTELLEPPPEKKCKTMTTICCQSQPCPSLPQQPQLNNSEIEKLFAFSQPAQNELVLEENLPKRLVHRATRFFVRGNNKHVITVVTSILDEFCYQWKVFAEGRNVVVVTITTQDRRKNLLVFKCTLIEIESGEGLVLLDFRLSRGDGLEFKRHYVRLKDLFRDLEVKIGASLEWLLG